MFLLIGGVHKLMILLRDFVDNFLTKFFGEEVGGSGGPRPPSEISKEISYDISFEFS